MVERRVVDLRPLLGIERLHQVHLDLERAHARLADVLVDVLFLALVRVSIGQAHDVDPELLELVLVEATDGDLLDTEDVERTRIGHGGSPAS